MCSLLMNMCIVNFTDALAAGNNSHSTSARRLITTPIEPLSAAVLQVKLVPSK